MLLPVVVGLGSAVGSSVPPVGQMELPVAVQVAGWSLPAVPHDPEYICNNTCPKVSLSLSLDRSILTYYDYYFTPI